MKRVAKIIIAVMFLGVFFSTNIKTYAKEGNEVTLDTEYGEFVVEKVNGVESIDDLISKLNDGTIELQNSQITTFEPKFKRDGLVEEPTSKCSNILGHKWGEWGHWSAVRVFTNANITYCLMERWRDCERTFCNARQREIDLLQLN